VVETQGKIIQVAAQWTMKMTAQVQGDNINKQRQGKSKDKRKKQRIIINLINTES
jgi:hypothetical protein